MPETTDTSNPFQLTPEGTYSGMVVSELPLKKLGKKTGKLYYEFKFRYSLNGKLKTHIERLMPWALKPFLLAFGYKETEKDKFVWERQDVIGKSINARIIHESDKNDPKTIRARMTEIRSADSQEPEPSTEEEKEEIPF